jgi:cytochrome P450/NADPH-cytochrome P450 reductase
MQGRPISRSRQLTYITQILKEALRLWPPAPAYGIAPLRTKPSAASTS